MKRLISIIVLVVIIAFVRNISFAQTNQVAVHPPLDGTLSGKFSVVDVGTTGSQTVPVPSGRSQCLRATVSGVTHVLPNPASGTSGVTYQFCSDGTNTYTLGTVGGTALFTGCSGDGGATLSVANKSSVEVIDNTTYYQCILFPVTSSGGISGLTTGQVGVAGSSTTLTTSVPFGLTGNSTLTETTSGGLLTPSILPLATSAAFGAVKVDGTTIGASSGVISTSVVAPIALTDAATITTNAALVKDSGTFTVTLTGNRTLADPTSVTSGQYLTWVITQDATGSRTLSYGAGFNFPGGTPVLQTAANSVDVITCVATATTPTMRCGQLGNVSSASGHIVTTGSAPTVSSCGTSPSITGNDAAGTITTGSGTVTSCTITFATAYTSTPVCTISDNLTSITPDISAINNTAMTVSFSATLTSGKIYYICLGSPN